MGRAMTWAKSMFTISLHVKEQHKLEKYGFFPLLSLYSQITIISKLIITLSDYRTIITNKYDILMILHICVKFVSHPMKKDVGPVMAARPE